MRGYLCVRVVFSNFWYIYSNDITNTFLYIDVLTTEAYLGHARNYFLTRGPC